MATEGIYTPLGGTERRVMLLYSVLVSRFTLINIFFCAVVAMVKLLPDVTSFPFFFLPFLSLQIYIYIFYFVSVVWNIFQLWKKEVEEEKEKKYHESLG